MATTLAPVSNLVSKITVNLKKADIESKVKAELKKIAKTVQVKGFRPGMVPVDMVKKMYGNGILAEELNKTLNDEVYKYLEENKVEFLASPLPAEDQKLNVDINSITDVSMDYEVGLAPEIDFSYIEKSPSFSKYKITVEDKMIDEEVDRIRKRFSTFAYPEDVQESDNLTFTIEELNSDGSLKEGGVSTVSSVAVDLLTDATKASVLKLKKQESFEANVFELMDRDRESVAKNILNMNDLSALENVGDKFRLTLNNITRAIPAEVNEEFFQKVYGENGPKTEDEMRANIKADLEAYFDGQTDSYLVNDIYKGMMDNVDFPLPDEFLKRWMDATKEKPISKEEIEKDYPAFAKSLRWSLMVRKVVKEQSIEVNAEEVKNKIRENAIRQLYGYGLANIGADWIEQFVNKQAGDEKLVRQTREQLLDDKVMDFLKTKVKLNEAPVALDDFKKMVETVNASVEDSE